MPSAILNPTAFSNKQFSHYILTFKQCNCQIATYLSSKRPRSLTSGMKCLLPVDDLEGCDLATGSVNAQPMGMPFL